MSSFAKDTPKTWVMTTLGGAYQIIGGGTPSTEVPDYWGGDTPWITSADIEGVREIRIRKYVTEEGITGSTTSKVPPRTLLVVTRVGLGKIAIAETSICFSQDLQGLIQDPRLIYPEFTLYLLSYELQILKFDGRGTTISGITKKQLKDLGFPLPPINEQHRIVAKIEELFSELDKGIENLKTARAQLKVYRQALLKHAFEGKLTQEWRAENQDKLETADALLARIQTERAQRYQQQLADWEAAGGSKPKAPKSLPPLTKEELAELPELPEGWVYSYLANMGDLGRGKSKHRPRNDPRLFGGDLPFIQTGEVKAANRVIRNHSQTYSEFGLAQSKLWPKGTLCITIAANIAETAFLGFGSCFPDSIVGFTAFDSVVYAEYIDYFIQAARTRIEAYAPATAQKNINLETLENLVVPYCSRAEQEAVLSELESKLSEADQLELTLTTSLQQAEALRQSILKKAFAGQLVPQDPHDEPASALLARIQAERAGVVARPRKNATGNRPLPVATHSASTNKET